MKLIKLIVDPSLPDLSLGFDRVVLTDDIKQADALICRANTPINQSYLKNTPIKFIATASSGYDHLDLDYLAAHNIHWGHAPGCNAEAVVDYVLSVLSALDINWNNKTIGILGYGHVGSRVAALFPENNKIIYDPPKGLHPNLDELIKTSDIICCHTPLTHAGPYPTTNMLSENLINQLKPGTIIINAGRGGIIEDKIILSRDDITWVLDVFNHEPHVNPAVIQHASLATPHIAGQTYTAKWRATQMAYCEVARFFGLSAAAADNKNIINKPRDILSINHQFKQNPENFNQIRCEVL